MKQVTEFYPPDWQYDKKGLDGYTYPDFRPFIPPDFTPFPTNKLSDKPFFRRLLLSLRDISHATSAATFIREDIDFNKSYGRADLRRFMCYETTLVVSYARPFSESKGGLPRLAYKRLGISLPSSTQKLHDGLISKRNKIFAHSDPDAISHSALAAMKGKEVVSKQPFSVLVPPRFIEGTLLDEEQFVQVELLIRYLSDSVYRLANEMHSRFPGEYTEYELEGAD